MSHKDFCVDPLSNTQSAVKLHAINGYKGISVNNGFISQ